MKESVVDCLSQKSVRTPKTLERVASTLRWKLLLQIKNKKKMKKSVDKRKVFCYYNTRAVKRAQKHRKELFGTERQF